MSSWGFFHFLMPVSVLQWHVAIGKFSCRYILRYPQSCNFFMKSKTVVVGFAFGILLNLFLISYFSYILLTHVDIEVNPGPKKNCSTNFSFCHWNLNSLWAHNYVKLSSLQAYNSVYRHDVICLSKPTLIIQCYQIKVTWIFQAINWLGLTIQEMLKEEEYAFTLKSPYLYVFRRS